MSKNLPKTTLTPYEMAVEIANLADNKKASDVLVLETGQVSYLADYFILCSGDSKTQVRSLTDEIEHMLKQQGSSPIGQERDGDFRWCLLDYGDVVVHIMNKKERQYYQLEHFWNHASEISREQWSSEKRAS